MPLSVEMEGCLCTAEQVVHTLPEGEPVCGVTSLDGEIYVLRPKGHDEVEVYDAISYRLQRCLTVPKCRGLSDMAASEHCCCVYIGDPLSCCIHRLVHTRLGAQGAATQWPVNDKPEGLSVNAAHNLLVTCPLVRKIKEFSSHGNLLRELTLPDDVINPWHAIETRSGQFLVCHGFRDDTVNRVCKMSNDGRQVVQSNGGKPGLDSGQYSVPIRLAIDDSEFVFVVDYDNSRVTLLSPTLDYKRQVVCSDDLKWGPDRLCLDTQRRRLYVSDNKWDNEKKKWTTGRVVLFNVYTLSPCLRRVQSDRN